MVIKPKGLSLVRIPSGVQLSSGRGTGLELRHRESRHVLEADVQGVSIIYRTRL